MTSVKFYERANKIYGFTIEGHAMYGAKGSDIVCSAVSATTQMALSGLLTYAGLKEGVVDSITVIDGNKPKVELIIEQSDITHSANAILLSFREFLVELSLKYPANVNVMTERA